MFVPLRFHISAPQQPCEGGITAAIGQMSKQNAEELHTFCEVTQLVSIALGLSQRYCCFLTRRHREKPVEWHRGHNQGLHMRQEAEGLHTSTHLWVEWELHVGFLPEAEFGEVIEDCQEMVIWGQCVFITDAQL